MTMKVSKVYVVMLVFTAVMMGFVSTAMAGGEGEGIFKAKKCSECHATSGPSKISTIEDWEKRKGPDLWFAGSKFNQAWLEAWLAAPTSIRGVKWNELDPNTEKHAALSGKEVHEVAEYLMSLKDSNVHSGSANQNVQKPQGKLMFEKKNACSACHQFKGGGKAMGGISGPSFVGGKDRLQPDWVAAFLKDPNRYEPKGRMPNFSGLSDSDMGSLAGYFKFLE